MNPALRTLALLGALVALLAGAGVIYYRTLSDGDATQTAGPPASAAEPDGAAPWVIDAAEHPQLAAGLQALQDNNLEAARASLAAVPVNSLGYAMAQRQLAVVHMRLGALDESFAASVRWSDADPETVDAHLNLAAVAFEFGRYDVAEQAALRAIELQPRDVMTRFDLALIRVAAGNLPHAIGSYERALALEPEQAALTLALQRLIQFSQRHPQHVEVHYALAYFARIMNRPELEREHLEAFLSHEPSGPAATTARARLDEARAGANAAER